MISGCCLQTQQARPAPSGSAGMLAMRARTHCGSSGAEQPYALNPLRAPRAAAAAAAAPQHAAGWRTAAWPLALNPLCTALAATAVVAASLPLHAGTRLGRSQMPGSPVAVFLTPRPSPSRVCAARDDGPAVLEAYARDCAALAAVLHVWKR